MDTHKAINDLPTGTRLYPMPNGDVRTREPGLIEPRRAWVSLRPGAPAPAIGTIAYVEDIEGPLEEFRPFVSRCQVCEEKHDPHCDDTPTQDE